MISAILQSDADVLLKELRKPFRELLVDMTRIAPGPFKYTVGRKYLAEDANITRYLLVSEPFLYKNTAGSIEPSVYIAGEYQETEEGKIWYEDVMQYALRSGLAIVRGPLAVGPDASISSYDHKFSFRVMLSAGR